MSKIDIQQYYSNRFELTMQLRDKHGHPTGITKTMSSDTIDKIVQFWHRHKAPSRKKKRHGEKPPSAQQAAKILKEIYGDK